MKKFMDDNFLLNSPTAEKLYHEYAKDLPIIDYHCHLPPGEIASDKKFANLTKIWLDGDHYKWRAMRANGVDESFCTGNKPDIEKFKKWAETVPDTLRNPLYHWTHLELRRYFGIQELLKPSSADTIYEKANSLLKQDDYSVRNLMRKMKVETVCTTDDPADNLESHLKIKNDGFEINILPTWRPDKAMAVEDAASYNQYLDKLGESANINISVIGDLYNSLISRQYYFHELGCRISDHGLETIYVEDFTEGEISRIFLKIRSGKNLLQEEILKFKSALLIFFAKQDYNRGWTQQFHLGAIRNNNGKMFELLGSDKGFDSVGDFEMARPISKFLGQLSTDNKLTKTIFYNLNPRDNELLTTMMGNFNDGITPGKMQFGSGWWFLDQKDGMTRQINALSSMGMLSRFVGMLTDSRSFLSYPRHEYFRRILCNLIGQDVENGELPNDIELLGQMVSNISYYNAKNYFKLGE
jgi:glucuronate isomerase